jgi:GTP-binding protein YchF
MGLKCGIVGLPNVGKSTLFNALTAAGALAANYPFATKEPNIGVITVPDPRLDKLTEIVKPESKVPNAIEVLDIAGLIKGASKGEGLGNQFLANIREVDAIIHVVRCFEDDNIVHVDGSIDPVRDKEIIDTELLLKDLETLEKRLEKIKKQAKSGDKAELKKVAILEEIKTHILQGESVRSFHLEKEAESIKHDLNLLTDKPILYLCNVSETDVKNGNAYTERLKAAIATENAEMIVMCAGIEAEIMSLEDEEEKMEFVEAMGLDEPGVHKVIRASYKLLELITFFTAGPKEVRAWTLRKGLSAPQAAGTIHSDFERGFIRAEVIKFDDYINYGTEAAVKQAGKMSLEGKEYIVEDADVIYFRFNV